MFSYRRLHCCVLPAQRPSFSSAWVRGQLVAALEGDHRRRHGCLFYPGVRNTDHSAARSRNWVRWHTAGSGKRHLVCVRWLTRYTAPVSKRHGRQFAGAGSSEDTAGGKHWRLAEVAGICRPLSVQTRRRWDVTQVRLSSSRRRTSWPRSYTTGSFSPGSDLNIHRLRGTGRTLLTF